MNKQFATNMTAKFWQFLGESEDDKNMRIVFATSVSKVLQTKVAVCFHALYKRH